MMRPDIDRCKPAFRRRWITKNRKKQTLVKSVVVALCLGVAVSTAFYLFAAGAKSANAESAAISVPELASVTMAPLISAPVQEQASPFAAPEPAAGFALPGSAEPVSSVVPKPALMPEKKPQIKVVLGDSVMQLQTELMPKHQAVPKAARKAEAQKPKAVSAAVTVQPVKAPAVKVVQVQVKKVEHTDSAPSVIPSFENTSGEPVDKKVEVAAAKDAEAPVWSTLLSVVVKLAMVVGLAYVSILGLKWFMSQKERPASKGSGLKVVDSVSLGANRSLHVVDCAGKRLILASTPNQVNLISETEAAAAAEQPAGQTFDAYLNSYVASQSEVDSAAVKVGQALRNGAAFLQKKAAEYRAHKASGESNRNA